MTSLWFLGRSNQDDVIGLLEQMLAIAVALVVLFLGQNLILETCVLVVALSLPAAKRNHGAIERSKADRETFIPF